MNKFIVAAGFAAALAATASAKQIDMVTVTCAELAAYDQTSLFNHLLWVDGYMSAKSGQTVLDTDAIQAIAVKIVPYCQANAEALVIEAIPAAMAAP